MTEWWEWWWGEGGEEVEGGGEGGGRGNTVKIRQWTLVRPCTKISQNKSWRYGNHIMESTSANRQSHS
jgi:hypothetical protein